MDLSSNGTLKELIDAVIPRLTPGAADPHEVLDHLSWSSREEVEIEISRAWRNYSDQSWVSTVMDAWTFPDPDETV